MIAADRLRQVEVEVEAEETPPKDPDAQLARLAGAIAEPARARMLCCLLDGHARTATELAAVAEVGASTASSHLARLKAERLVVSVAQGKHRYFRLASSDVGAALEGLLVVAGTPRAAFRPAAPSRLRAARTCYDHLAGAAGVALHDRLHAQGWLSIDPAAEGGYLLSDEGAVGCESLGIDIARAGRTRRRFACACLDWSERRPHLGGALGAAWLDLALARGWVRRELDGRAVTLTRRAAREVPELFGL
ncbi:Transcriptional regulator, ArsR family [Burkholderiales bacterium 8X]|nr:Transcriptional regulator, ArsR family [Burkholderiales bacterium 8X]